MPATREQLEAWVANLEERLASGVRSIRDQNGEQVEYASGREMAAALDRARRQLAATPARPIHTIRFNMTKGL